MENCKEFNIPMQPKLQLVESNGTDEKLPFKELLGSLMYIMLGSRPDLSFCVTYFSQFQSRYSSEHWYYLKHTLHYLKCTEHFGLIYKKNENNMFIMEQWFRYQYDLYNYGKAQSFSMSVRSLFKHRFEDNENLIGNNNNNNVNTRCVSTKTNKKKRAEVNKFTGEVKDENGNQIWSKPSTHSYRKRRQQRQEEKTKPRIAAVLRTYDKRRLQKDNVSYWL
nr:unnamed protein product [Callosobruchus analis]